MPTHKLFEEYAKRIEREMSPKYRKDSATASKEKFCGECGEVNDLDAPSCGFCESAFPIKEKKFVACGECAGLNVISAKECQFCGTDFGLNYTLELEEAFRMGAIIRGMELDEQTVQEGEGMSEDVRERILESGDAAMLRFLRTFPEESFAEFRRIIGGEG